MTSMLTSLPHDVVVYYYNLIPRPRQCRLARAGRGLFAVRPGGDERTEDEDDAARPNPVDERVQEDAECGRVGARRLPVDQDDVEVLRDGRAGRRDGHRLAGALV